MSMKMVSFSRAVAMIVLIIAALSSAGESKQPVDRAQLRMCVVQQTQYTNHTQNNNTNTSDSGFGTGVYANNTFMLYGASSGCFECTKVLYLWINSDGDEERETEYVSVSSRYPYTLTVMQYNWTYGADNTTRYVTLTHSYARAHTHVAYVHQ